MSALSFAPSCKTLHWPRPTINKGCFHEVKASRCTFSWLLLLLRKVWRDVNMQLFGSQSALQIKCNFTPLFMITEHFMELEKQVRSLNYKQAESGKSSAISFSLSSSSGAWYSAKLLSESLLYSDISPFNSTLYIPTIFYNRSRAFQLIPKQVSHSRNESCIRD
jgi:hypothetical protein